jgi:GNAT superfamily N-acetyltransferase
VNARFTVRQASAEDAPAIAVMVGALLDEIMRAIGQQAFRFDAAETRTRLMAFLEGGHYHVFVVHDEQGIAVGFLSLYESYALYAEGAFGTIPELYVRPEHRGCGLGHRLIAAAQALGFSRGWTRLEVTTPPLPEYEQTLRFYEREGFVITGGRKLKHPLS